MTLPFKSHRLPLMTTDSEWLAIGPYDKPILETAMSTELKTTIELLKTLREHELETAHGHSIPALRKVFQSKADVLRDAISLLESTGKDVELVRQIEAMRLANIYLHRDGSCSVRMSVHGAFQPPARGNTLREAITAAMQKEEVDHE